MTKIFHSVHNFMKGAVGNFLVERIDGDFYELVYVNSIKEVVKHYIFEYVETTNEIEVACDGVLYNIDEDGNITTTKTTAIVINLEKSEIIRVQENMMNLFLTDPNPLLRRASKDWYDKRVIA